MSDTSNPMSGYQQARSRAAFDARKILGSLSTRLFASDSLDMRFYGDEIIKMAEWILGDDRPMIGGIGGIAIPIGRDIFDVLPEEVKADFRDMIPDCGNDDCKLHHPDVTPEEKAKVKEAFEGIIQPPTPTDLSHIDLPYPFEHGNGD